MDHQQDNTNLNNDEAPTNLPLVCNDARYRAGRKLMKQGQVHLGAIKIFYVLMNRTNEEFGESSMESAAVRYEYGYAIFLDTTRETMDIEDDTTIGRSSTLLHRQQMIASVSKHNDVDDGEMSDEDTKVEIALEHMVIACEILYKYINENETAMDDTKKKEVVPSISEDDANRIQSYATWAMEQLPRMLIGIGYVLSHQGKHPDALNSYLNALPYRTKHLQQIKCSSTDKTEITLDQLVAHRLLVEVYVLIVEELLQCPADVDIMIPESNDILIKKEERISIAKDHYEKAREDLQEVIILMSKLDALGESNEKENVCHLATLVMEAGISISTVTE